jgi:signal transduction histidine kinase
VLERATFGPLNEKQFEYIQQIGSSGEHLLALINQVLDLAKIEANSEHLELTDVDLTEAAAEALHVVGPLATKKRLELVGPVGSGHVTVTADPLKVRQILLNLLSNAVKFTPDGGMVGVEIDATPTSAAITVWDTGIGIGDDEHHLLFEPFQQLDGSLAREHEGTGLGLALVQRLAELHGGSVSVESRLGHGSRFVVSIPRTAGVQRTGDLEAVV